MTKLASTLFIQHLELQVHIGWSDEERQQKQSVFLDMDIGFTKPPKACTTDQLQDTLCYATLINLIRTKTAHQHFHLIEHLSYTILQLIKPLLPQGSNVNVHITKHPNDLSGLGGVRFSYWDSAE